MCLPTGGVVSQHALQQVSRGGGAIPACIAGGIPACLAKGLQGVPGLRGFGVWGVCSQGVCAWSGEDAWSGGCLVWGVCSHEGSTLGGPAPRGVPGLGACSQGEPGPGGRLVFQHALLRQTPLERRLLLRTIRIKLECILVYDSFSQGRGRRGPLAPPPPPDPLLGDPVYEDLCRMVFYLYLDRKGGELLLKYFKHFEFNNESLGQRKRGGGALPDFMRSCLGNLAKSYIGPPLRRILR